jgi:two-component system invasion response regulator UvrY
MSIMSRILIADDHAVVRAGYKQFLEAESSIIEVGEAADGKETLETLRRQKWDLLLMDIHMPDCSGLDVLELVSSSYPELQVLIMSGLPEEQYARNVLCAGARGYLPKGSSPEELLRAVRLVLNGRRYISAALAESMAADLGRSRPQNGPLHTALSGREFAIFCKLAAGTPVTRIARQLHLNVKTVSTYRSRVLAKMNFKSNADITAYALRHGLIQYQEISSISCK